MPLVACDHRHADAIRDIFNDAILHSTSLYDHEPRSADAVDRWISGKQESGYPIIGILGDDDQLMGFASYGSFRASVGYQFTIEHSIYVAAPFRGRGIGRTLLTELIRSAVDQNFHTMIGGIDGANHVSIALHKSLGFSHCATIREAGFKFNRWLDLHFYQLILPARDKRGS
ncbi:MAG: GNAT family N-acetyltransferase [Planctomycetaceae bacterium]